MSDHMVDLTDSNVETEVLQSKIPVLVDFWASWCRPCLMIAPTVEALAQDYNGRAKVGKLNVDENMGVAGKYKIQGIPALLLFKEGEVRDQIMGAQSKETIQAMLDRNL